MPIMRRTYADTDTTFYVYVPPDAARDFAVTGWVTHLPDPVEPGLAYEYRIMTTQEPLALWERELLQAQEAAPVVAPEAGDGDEPVDDRPMCDACGEVCAGEWLSISYNRTLCQQCWDDIGWMCEWCQGSFTDDDSSYYCDRPSASSVCESCFSDVIACEFCNTYYDTNEFGNCPNGCDEDDRSLHDYSYKPSPVFHYIDEDGKAQYTDYYRMRNDDKHMANAPFMGFELEMERNGSGTTIDYVVDLVKDHWSDFAYCKHDGSLNNGLELVTHPFTLEYAHQQIDWRLLERIRGEGFRSWNTQTSGMHVHVNRATFDGAAHLFRFAQLIYKNEPTCSSFAGRSNNSYASFQDGYQKGYLAQVVKGRAHGSRGAVNMLNGDTIEVRIFRGSLRYQRVLANLEFVHAAVEYTRQLTVPDVVRGGLSWRAFATWILDNRTTYTHLYDYLDLNPTNPNHTNEPALATY